MSYSQGRVVSHAFCRLLLLHIQSGVMLNLCAQTSWKSLVCCQIVGTSSRVSDLEQVAIILIINLSSFFFLSSFQVVTFLPEG